MKDLYDNNYEKLHGKKILNEEEIESLINDIEKNHMLKAPRNLKNDILNVIDNTEIKEKKHRDNVTLTFYSIKVAVSVAAAILVLFITPTSKGNDCERDSKFIDGLGKFTSQIEKCIEMITPSSDIFKFNYKEK